MDAPSVQRVELLCEEGVVLSVCPQPPFEAQIVVSLLVDDELDALLAFLQEESFPSIKALHLAVNDFLRARNTLKAMSQPLVS